MKFRIPPINAGFVNRILCFNLTKEPIDCDGLFEGLNVHIIFNLDDDIIAVDMENYLFYSYNKNSQEMYGPYTDYHELISEVLFGKYDGLFYVLSKIKKNINTGQYEFVFDDFIYNIDTYRTLDFAQTAEKLVSIIKKINVPSEFSFTPETVFDENVINGFLISLNNVFRLDNFPFNHIKNDYMELIRIDKGDIDGFKKSCGDFFIVINTNTKAHLVVFLPFWVSEGFISYEDKTNSEFVKEIFTDEKIVINNEKEISLAKKLFNIDDSALRKEVEFYKVDISKYLVVVVPGQELDITSYILQNKDKFYILDFNAVSRKFVLRDFEEFESNGIPVSVQDGKIVIGNYCLPMHDDNVVINVDECLTVNTKTGIGRINNIEFDLRFLNHYKGLL